MSCANGEKMSAEYLAAFDVGGTKLDAVLFDTAGHIVSHVRERGGIPLEIGAEAAERYYLAALRKLTAGYEGRVATLYGSVATIEYFGDGIQNNIKTALSLPCVRLEGDGMCLISGMLGHNDGCSIVCGTGSALFVREGDRYWHTGGWGHLIDSCGSGFVLGRMALQAALRAHDKRAEPTLLLELASRQCGEPIWEHYVRLYEGGRAYIASFAGTVFEARRAGDPVARRIFDHCAGELADLVWVARRELGHDFDLVYNGGIFFNHRDYAEAVRALSPSGVRAIFSDVKPIYGCAVEAMHDVGLVCGEAFRRAFLGSYDAT